MKKYSCLTVTIVLLLIYGCKNTSTYPISEPSASTMDDRVTGKWKFEEDTNKNNFYEIYPADINYPHQYHIRFWNRGGTNPTYESNGHFSKIGDETFFNLPYFERGTGSEMFQKIGFIFIRLLDVDSSFTKITGAIVGDTTMRALHNEREVYNFVAKHMDQPGFYSDTVHIFKVNN